VWTIERLPDLLVEAEERFRRLRLAHIETRLGDGARGWPERAPFHGILVTAAAPDVPPPLVAQLVVGGRLVIPIGDLSAQELVILTRTPAGLDERRAASPTGDCSRRWHACRASGSCRRTSRTTPTRTLRFRSGAARRSPNPTSWH